MEVIDLGENVGVFSEKKFNFYLARDKYLEDEERKLSYWYNKTGDKIKAFIYFRLANKYKKYFVPRLFPKDFKNIERIYEIQEELFEKRSIRKLKNHSESRWQEKFWIFRGYSEEEAKQKVSEIQRNNALKFSKKIKENPEKYRDSFNTKIEYWLKKGYTLEQAKEKLKERQSTGRLDKFIEREGPIKGYIKWKQRQEKWQNTLNSKSPEEIERINKSKALTLEKMIEKYGEEEGRRKWEEMNKSKAITLENMIRKYGKEEGEKRYKKWKEKNN